METDRAKLVSTTSPASMPFMGPRIVAVSLFGSLATYGVIMAGGIGSRFWPQSREAFPKQFLSVFGTSSLLQQTLARINPIVPTDRSYVVTHDRYAELTREQLPGVHVLAEPISRNTAPCIAYAAVVLRAIDPA